MVELQHAVSTDPGDFVARLEPVAWNVRAEPTGGRPFRSDLYAANLDRLGLFTVRMSGARVERPPERYAAVTVPADAPLRFFRRRQGSTFYPGSAHLLHTTDPFEMQVGPNSGMFVAIFDGQWIDTVTWRLTQNKRLKDLHPDWRLDLTSSAGQSLRHFFDFIWSETCRGGPFTRSALAVREIENTCTTLLILAAEAESRPTTTATGPSLGKTTLELAEEYLAQNLTEPFSLDKLIEITGTSASTLLREFRKRHGMPPLRFLRLRRLEAARGELHSAEPNETSVTEVATTYGFYHLGRFARQYRQTFGELPSETLRRHASFTRPASEK